MRTSSCVTILFILGLFALGTEAQFFQWFGFPNQTVDMHVYGTITDLPPLVVGLANPLLTDDPSGRVHTPVTIVPVVSRPFIAVNPNPIVLNDANNFQAIITFTPVSLPVNWSDAGVVVSWTVSPNPNYTEPPPNITLALQPNSLEICIDDINCQAPGANSTIPPLLIGYPSRPITIRAKVPPPGDVQISLAANGTNARGDNIPQPLVFSTNPIVLTPSQPWATFTVASPVFPNSGFVVMTILSQSQGGTVFQPLPSNPSAVSFTYSTRQIASTVPDFNSSTPLKLYVGVPTQIAVHLEYPLPSGTASIAAFSQGDALNISGPASFTAGSTIGYVTVTATKYVAGPLNIFFATTPRDDQGPILPPSNLTVQIARRELVTEGPVANATGPGRVFLGEPFPLSFELPFSTPNFVEFSVSGPTSGNTAVFSFDKNIVRLDNTNTHAVIFVTPTQWVAENADQNGDSFDAAIFLSLLRTAGSDWQLYEEPGDIALSVSRRSFYVPDSQSDGNSTIRLRYGQTSRPILVAVPWPPTLQNLAGDVVLTPYANTQLGFTRFTPPFLTWNKNSPQSQNITVTVLPQSSDIGIPTAFSVHWILSGSATDIQWFARQSLLPNFPTFTVGQPAFNFWTPGSLSGLTDGGALTALNQLVGEPVTVLVAPEEFPPTGVTLTIFCPDTAISVPGATSVNMNTASITFGPTGPINAQFQITPQSADPAARIVDFELSGPDAAFYSVPGSISLTVSTRTLTFSSGSASIPLGHVNDRVYVYLKDLPQNDLTVSLVPTSAASAAAFTFTPNSMTFGPATPYSRSFVAEANALGTYTYNIELGGTDAKWYSLSTQQVTFTGTLRDQPEIDMPSTTQLVPGLLQGPFTVTLEDAPDQDLTVTPRAGDWTFTPPAVTFAAGQLQAIFSATYTPEFVNSRVEDAKTEIFFTLSGSDAWKYQLPTPVTFVSGGADVSKRRISLGFDNVNEQFVIGVPAMVRAFIDGPSPLDITINMVSAGFTFSPAAQVTIPKGQLSAWFTVTATAAPTMYFNTTQGLGSSSVRVFFSLANEGAPLFDVPAFQDWAVVLRGFLYDVMQPATAPGVHVLQNTAGTGVSEVLMLGKPSSVITVTAQIAPSASVTLTPTNPYLSFQPAQLTFSPGVQSIPFTITPSSVPPRGRPTTIDWLLSGPDAAFYETSKLPTGANLFIIPQLNFTFPSAVYIDGQADVLVTVIGAVPSEGFTLHVSAAPKFGIAIEPSALNFGGSGVAPAPDTPAPNTTAAPTAAPTAAQPTGGARKFTIKHLRPSQVPFPNYPLTYTLKYGGFGSNDVVLPVGSVPLYASVVTVLRYGIVPDFPFTLGYRNCKASINITRAPLNTLLITPSSPIESGVDVNGLRTDGNKDPAGRVIFTPPILVFPPGQRVANFMVRIDRRLDDDALYYRIDYKVDGIQDDTVAYLPFLSTWHIGSASAHQVVLLLAVVLPLALALLL